MKRAMHDIKSGIESPYVMVAFHMLEILSLSIQAILAQTAREVVEHDPRCGLHEFIHNLLIVQQE